MMSEKSEHMGFEGLFVKTRAEMNTSQCSANTPGHVSAVPVILRHEKLNCVFFKLKREIGIVICDKPAFWLHCSGLHLLASKTSFNMTDQVKETPKELMPSQAGRSRTNNPCCS